MTTLTITNEQGTVFNYSKDGEFLIINVLKNGNTNEYKTYNKNNIKDGKLKVCREDGSWVEMPVNESVKVQDFMKSRTTVTFNSLDERNEYAKTNNIGQSFEINGVITAYKYN